MSNAAPERRAKQSRDPVVQALNRLLTSTDRSIAASVEVRKARIELANLLEKQAQKPGGRRDG